MMEIIADKVSKKYISSQYIIKDQSLKLQSNKIYGISGSNGSGKTTLLSLLSGIIIPSKGSVSYYKNGFLVPSHLWFRHISMAAPYADLYDYLSVYETVEFVQKLKGWKINRENSDILEYIKLNHKRNTPTRELSSGMKQRLKLGIALLANTQVVFLDEPLSNLDQENKYWYKNLLMSHCSDRIVVIASNEKEDFDLVHLIIDLETSV